MDLGSKKCKPCEGGVRPFDQGQIEQYIGLVPGWNVNRGGRKIMKDYSFPNFKKALAFVNTVGAIAEDEGHHPDIYLAWGKVSITLLTHAIGGLSENDFIVAYKIDAKAAR